MSLVRSSRVSLARVLPSWDSRKSTFCSWLFSPPLNVSVTRSNVGISLGRRGPTSTITLGGRSYCAWTWRWIFAFNSGEIAVPVDWEACCEETLAGFVWAEHPALTSNNKTATRFINKRQTAFGNEPEQLIIARGFASPTAGCSGRAHAQQSVQDWPT